MLVAAAVCPHPPAIVPDLAAASAGELDEVRDACAAAIDAVGAAAPDVLVVVGAGEASRRYGPGAPGSFAPFGVDVRVALPGQPAEPQAGEPAGPEAGEDAQLPLPLAVGAWLLGRAGWSGEVRGELVAADAAVGTCVALGASIAREADRVAMLVMGDGSACRSQSAPRPFDTRAAGFDATVAAALGSGDPAELLAVDGALATELAASGRAAWQVLAGAAEDALFDAEVLYDDAPYGVGYVVAVWERHG